MLYNDFLLQKCIEAAQSVPVKHNLPSFFQFKVTQVKDAHVGFRLYPNALFTMPDHLVRLLLVPAMPGLTHEHCEARPCYKIDPTTCKNDSTKSNEEASTLNTRLNNTHGHSVYRSSLIGLFLYVISFVSNLVGLSVLNNANYARFFEYMYCFKHLAGLGFGIAAIFKFKQHRDNPIQIPIEAPFALLAVSVMYVMSPDAPPDAYILGSKDRNPPCYLFCKQLGRFISIE